MDAGTASEQPGCRGVLLAGIIGATGNQTPLAVVGEGFEGTAGWLGLAAFALVCAGFYGRVLRQR